MKPLLFVILLATSVHVAIAYQDNRARGHEPLEAAWTAAAEKRQACLLALLTTALGFGSSFDKFTR